MTAKFIHIFLVSTLQPTIIFHYPKNTTDPLPAVLLHFFFSCILSPLFSELHVPPISHPLISPLRIMQSLLRNCEHPPSGTHTFPFITQFQSIFSSMHDEYTRGAYGIQYMTLFEHDIFKNTSRGFQNEDNDLLLPAFTFSNSTLPETAPVAYPGILFGGVQQIQLRTERMRIWRR